MSFDQSLVERTSKQSRNIFDTYIYRTEDTCAEVSAVGYFDECRFLINDPDSWNNSILEVLASDCFSKGIIGSSGEYVPLVSSDSGGGFCSPASLILNPDPSPTQNVVLSGPDNLTATATSTTNSAPASATALFDGSTTFTTQTEEVKFEIYLESESVTPAGLGSIAQAFFGNGLYVACGYNFQKQLNGLWTCFDINSGTPILTNIPLVGGDFKSALYLDPVPAGGASRIVYRESDSDPIVSGPALTMNPSYVNTDPMLEVNTLSAGIGIGDNISITVNQGSSAFLLGEDAERWCNV